MTSRQVGAVYVACGSLMLAGGFYAIGGWGLIIWMVGLGVLGMAAALVVKGLGKIIDGED